MWQLLFIQLKRLSEILSEIFIVSQIYINGIPIATSILFAFGGPKINPVIAGGAMAFSSISMLLNALRLKRLKRSINYEGENYD